LSSPFEFKPLDFKDNKVKRSQCLRNFLGDLTFIDQKSSLLATLNTSSILSILISSISFSFLISLAHWFKLGFLIFVVALIISYICFAIAKCFSLKLAPFCSVVDVFFVVSCPHFGLSIWSFNWARI